MQLDFSTHKEDSYFFFRSFRIRGHSTLGTTYRFIYCYTPIFFLYKGFKRIEFGPAFGKRAAIVSIQW